MIHTCYDMYMYMYVCMHVRVCVCIYVHYSCRRPGRSSSRRLQVRDSYTIHFTLKMIEMPVMAPMVDITSRMNPSAQPALFIAYGRASTPAPIIVFVRFR